MKKILYIYGFKTIAFNDAEMLESKYEVKLIAFPESRSLFSLLKFSAIALYYSIFYMDIYIGNMGGSHNWISVFASKLLRRPSAIILGGVDAQYLPSLDYGIFTNKGISSILNKWCYQAVDYLLPVDESLIRSNNTYLNDKKDYPVGVLNHHPKISPTKIITIPTEYNQIFWNINRVNFRIIDILTVAKIDTEKDFQLKGIDLIVATARRNPQWSFSLIGLSEDMILSMKHKIPHNLTLQGFLNPHALRIVYQSSKIFLLPSLTEGLPNVLCESMLCGCLPVGSNVGGIPKAVGDTGVILQAHTIKNIERGLKSAFDLPLGQNLKSRKRIIDLFGNKTRKTKLLDFLSNIG